MKVLFSPINGIQVIPKGFRRLLRQERALDGDLIPSRVIALYENTYVPYSSKWFRKPEDFLSETSIFPIRKL